MDDSRTASEPAIPISRLVFAFWGYCIYIGALSTTVSHEMLLVGRGFTLPPLGAEVTLEQFYIVTPLILVAFHLLLLLDRGGIEGYTLPELSVSILRWLTYAILPLGVLFFVQGQFLPYHSRITTFWQQLLVTIDLALILIFRSRISSKRENGSKPGLLWRRVIAWPVLITVIATALFFSWSVAAVPEPSRHDDLASLWPFGWPERNLSLRGRDLIAKEPAPELVAIYAEEEGLSLDDAQRKLSKGISLRRRDLTGADFTGAGLVNADFRGADLRNANFTGADLRGAKFMPARSADGRFDRPAGSEKRFLIANARGDKALPSTRIEKANFTDANLEGASLILVKAAGATLARADLRGVELTYADLRGARLQGAKLAGADLWHAILQEADLTQADLRAADLSFSELEGAALAHAHLLAADLSEARLAGAWFAGADLRAVQFRDAESTGASFRGAILWSSRGLILRGIILRQAKLDALCPDPGLPPQLVDLREVEPPNPKDEGKVWDARLLDGVPEGPRRKAALNRLGTQPIQPYCKAGVPLRPPANLKYLGLLYHDERRSDALKPDLLKDWPPVAEQAIQAGSAWTEDDFYVELAALWAEDACRSESFARAMLRLAARPPILAEEKLVAALKDRLKQRLEQARQERATVEGPPGVGLPCPALLSLEDEDLKKLSLQAP